MSASRWVGNSPPRVDAPDKVSGRTLYIHDFERPGMLWGAIKWSEHAHARIVRIDTSRAEALPGVVAVVTGFNTPPVGIGFLRDGVVLKADKVRSLRDEVAAVAALDEETARAAVDLIEVEYEPLVAVFDADSAMVDGAPRIHEQDGRGRKTDSNRVPLDYGHETGDVDAARAEAAYVAEGDYTVPLIQQACMGTAGCVAEFDARGQLTIWAKTQVPFMAQREFTRALREMGIEHASARVIVPALGGGFGTGLETHPYEFISILLAWRTGRPVKILFNRHEEFTYTSPRQSARVHVAQGCDAEGRLLFREVRVVQDNGAYASWGSTYPTVMLLPVTSLYRVPNVRFHAEVVYTNNTYCQAMRGYGNPEVTFGIECGLDELAGLAGLSQAEIRQRNANKPGERTPMDLRISSCGLRECLDAVEEHLSNPCEETETAGGPYRRGIGMASFVHVGGSGRIYRSDASGILLKFDDFGTLHVRHGGVEMGQGLHTTLTQTLASELGLQLEQIRISETDTATCPWDVGTHASRGAFMACTAAIKAAATMREKLFALCPPVFPELVAANLAKWTKQHGRPDDADFDFAAAAQGGGFRLDDGLVALDGAPDAPWAAVELARVLRAIHFREDGAMLTARAYFEPPSDLPDWKVGVGNMSATYTFGVQGCEVEVDTETGAIRILKMVTALDVGTVLNPKSLKGQVYGGLAQGLGYALYEEVLTHEGRTLNPGFTDYKIPTAVEMDFPVETIFVETEDEFGPHGAKGAGEPALVPTAPAIANAIRAATGAELRDLPMTPERVLRALR